MRQPAPQAGGLPYIKLIFISDRWGYVAAGLALLGLILAGCSRESAVSARCFPSTGHTVNGEFLRVFEGLGGVASLGYPLTEPFEQGGRRVQYFEYARLEDHPDNPGGPVVKLSFLGEKLGRRQPPLAASRVPPASEPGSRYYPQMGHAVGGDFLTYFDQKGGLDRFGYPIAEPLVIGGQLAQDFQQARLVWQADRPPGDRVKMEAIGRVYFDVQGLDPALLSPVPCPAGND
jgi:hypothetical protein